MWAGRDAQAPRARRREAAAHLEPGPRARALFVLDRTHGRSMSELPDEWLCDASNATWIVDRLEERGLAERRTIPTDRRVKLVVLTATGDRTRHEMIRTLYEPPPELLELDLEDLKALRDAVAKLPLSGA